MLDGRFGRLSAEATPDDVLTTLGEPQDFLRRRAGEVQDHIAAREHRELFPLPWPEDQDAP